MKILVTMMLAASALMLQSSCSVADDVIVCPSSCSDEETALLSRIDAQNLINDYVENNTYLDYDFTTPSPRIPESNRGMITVDEVITRVIWYRFYKLMAFDNDHIVVNGIASDINISQRAFNHCMAMVIRRNKSIAECLSAGESLEEVLKNHFNITPESIERVIRLR